MPMRIVHLITGLSTGGAERTLLRLLERIDRESFDCSVVSLTDRGTIGAALEAAGVKVESLGMSRGIPSPRPFFRLRRFLRATRADVLQTWLYHADLLGLVVAPLAGVPRLVWNVRCSDVDVRDYGLSTRLSRAILTAASRAPDAVVANSRAGIESHERIGYRTRRWELISNGIDTNVFRPDIDSRLRIRAELAIDPRVPVLGSLGRFDPAKDYGTLLAAAAAARRTAPSTKIVLAGRGMTPENGELAAMIARHGLGDSVILPGERPDAAAVLNAFDLFCLSSYTEGFPNAVAEAMACAVPVVVTDSGDAAGIVGDPERVVPVRNPSALAEGIERLLGLPEDDRRSVGFRDRERIEQHFGIDAMVRRYEQLYASLA
jgi:glycosyltransferase involved in cell wall biosynthesis